MKKLHKTGIAIISALAPAAALGVTLGVTAIAIKNKEPEPGPVDPEVKVTGVKLPPYTYVTLGESSAITLDPIISPANATNKNVTWESSNPDKISVDDNGKLRFSDDNASATITCTTKDGGFQASCIVTAKKETDDSYFDFSAGEDLLTGERIAYIYVKQGVTSLPSEVVLPAYHTFTETNETLPVGNVYIAAEGDITEPTSVIIPSTYSYISLLSLVNLKNINFSDAKECRLTELYSMGTFKNLTSIRLNNSIKTIEYKAFQSCNNLETIDFSFASNITTIDEYAFSGCTKLQPFTIPDSLRYFNNSALDYNVDAAYASMFTVEKLTEEINVAYLKKDKQGTNDHYIALGYMVPSTWGTYSDIALSFDKDTALIASNFHSKCIDYDGTKGTWIMDTTSITFNDNLKYVGESAFVNPSLMSEDEPQLTFKVSKLSFPKSLRAIGYGAFRNGSDFGMIGPKPISTVTSIELNDGLEYIGNTAFADQNSITKIEFPASLTQIGEISTGLMLSLGSTGAFQGCYSLNTITFADDSKLTTIGDFAFAELLSSNETVVTKTIDVKLPDSVEYIGKSAFCNSFIPKNEFVIPANCKYLGQYSLWFFNYYLTESSSRHDPINITIPNSVTYMRAPFGYEEENENGYYYYPCVSASTLSFADKSNKWDVSYTGDLEYEKEITISSSGKLSDEDFNHFLAGSKWEESSVTYYPYSFEWYKQTSK